MGRLFLSARHAVEGFSPSLRQPVSNVEIDSTFYGTPAASTLTSWNERTPQDFIFAVKVPQVITHEKVLVDCEPEFDEFIERMHLLGDKLGPMLLQFPKFDQWVLKSPDELRVRLHPSKFVLALTSLVSPFYQLAQRRDPAAPGFDYWVGRRARYAKTMKTAHAFLLAVLMATSAASTLARGKSIYTLVLEVQSHTAVRDGSYVTTGILTTPKGKFRCTLLDQKHYLIAGPHRARKIGRDRLRVIVPIKKHKNERWTFKIISEEEVGN